MRDEMRAFAEQGDLTSAAIRYQQKTEESQRSYQPATLGGVGGGLDENLKLGVLRMAQKHVIPGDKTPHLGLNEINQLQGSLR